MQDVEFTITIETKLKFTLCMLLGLVESKTA
jgi:hypothetical protein